MTTAPNAEFNIIKDETPVAENRDDLKPRIMVMGVGGAGGNAVNNMIRSNLEGVEFIICNTDAQAISQSSADTRIQLGLNITQGLGAGSKPEIGSASAEESIEEVIEKIKGTHMLFITAGMGGGTGTGAAPVIAKAAKDMGILTVGVVTKPFQFEGVHRMNKAESGIEELQEHVDTLIVIPNQNLFRIANENTTFADAFKMADEVLYSGVRSVTDLMIMPGLINLDFADVRTVMSEMGKAMMGTGEAEGDKRSILAAEAAIANPLLDEVSMKGARGVLISVTGGMDMTLFEVDEAANRIREEVEVDANIIFGSTFDDRLNGKIRVSVVATGIDQSNADFSPMMKEAVANLAEESELLEIDTPEEDREEIYTTAPAPSNEDQPTPMEEPMAEPKADLTPDFGPQEDELYVEPKAPARPPKKQGLFSKLFGGSKAAPEQKPVQAPRTRVQTTDMASDFDDDVSDIPAYLRKQS